MKQAILAAAPVFDWVWRTSAMASVTVVLLLLVKGLLGNKLNIRWHYSLWLLLLIRLVLPWAPESPLSPYRLLPFESYDAGPAAPIVLSPPSLAADGRVSFETLPAAARTDGGSAEAPSGTPLSGDRHKPDAEAEAGPPVSPVYTALLAVWLAGTVGFAAVLLGQYRRFAKKARMAVPVADAGVLAAFELCRRSMNIRTDIPLLVTDQVASPTLYGLVRPKLLLPARLPNGLDSADYSHIFWHELAHCKRMDIGVNWLMTGLLTLHWFNPLLWLAASRMREEQELACDALALSIAGAERAIPYGRTLMKLLESQAAPVRQSGTIGFFSDKARIYRRIDRIGAFGAKSYSRSLPGLAIALLLAACSLTNAGSASGGGGSSPPADGAKSLSPADQRTGDGVGGQTAAAQQPPASDGERQAASDDDGAVRQDPLPPRPPKTVDAGTVRFRANERQTAAVVPLVAITAAYGVSGPEAPPVAPPQPLPDIRFPIPPGQESALAAYWVTITNDGDQGILLLGPRGWRASAEIGANGSIAITLVNPDDDRERLTYSDTGGGCQGCAISSIAAYFPAWRDWAESLDFAWTDMRFIRQTPLSPSVMAYDKPNENAGYETNGVAYQQHGDSNWFRMMEMGRKVEKDHAEERRSLATTMLNYFVAAYGQPPANDAQTAGDREQEPASPAEVTPGRVDEARLFALPGGDPQPETLNARDERQRAVILKLLGWLAEAKPVTAPEPTELRPSAQLYVDLTDGREVAVEPVREHDTLIAFFPRSHGGIAQYYEAPELNRWLAGGWRQDLRIAKDESRSR